VPQESLYDFAVVDCCVDIRGLYGLSLILHEVDINLLDVQVAFQFLIQYICTNLQNVALELSPHVLKIANTCVQRLLVLESHYENNDATTTAYVQRVNQHILDVKPQEEKEDEGHVEALCEAVVNILHRAPNKNHLSIEEGAVWKRALRAGSKSGCLLTISWLLAEKPFPAVVDDIFSKLQLECSFTGPLPGSDEMRELVYQFGDYDHLESIELFSRQVVPSDRLKVGNIKLSVPIWQSVLDFGEVLAARCLLLCMFILPHGGHSHVGAATHVIMYAAKLCVDIITACDNAYLKSIDKKKLRWLAHCGYVLRQAIITSVCKSYTRVGQNQQAMQMIVDGVSGWKMVLEREWEYSLELPFYDDLQQSANLKEKDEVQHQKSKHIVPTTTTTKMEKSKIKRKHVQHTVSSKGFKDVPLGALLDV